MITTNTVTFLCQNIKLKIIKISQSQTLQRLWAEPWPLEECQDLVAWQKFTKPDSREHAMHWKWRWIRPSPRVPYFQSNWTEVPHTTIEWWDVYRAPWRVEKWPLPGVRGRTGLWQIFTKGDLWAHLDGSGRDLMDCGIRLSTRLSRESPWRYFPSVPPPICACSLQ